MGYSVRRAGEAEAKRVHESWGSLTWLAGKAVGNALGVTLGRVVIGKGTSNPPHSHPNCEEVLYLLSGRLEHRCGDETVTLEAGDTLVIEAGLPHCAKSTGDEDADMIVAYSSGERGFRLEDGSGRAASGRSDVAASSGQRRRPDQARHRGG